VWANPRNPLTLGLLAGVTAGVVMALAGASLTAICLGAVVAGGAVGVLASVLAVEPNLAELPASPRDPTPAGMARMDTVEEVARHLDDLSSAWTD
jgi:hypothetical protein